MNCGLANYTADGVGDRDLLTASSRALSAPELGTERVKLTLPLFEPGRFSLLHDGIGVPVDDLPVTIFTAINLRDAQSEWAQFVTPLRLHCSLQKSSLITYSLGRQGLNVYHQLAPYSKGDWYANYRSLSPFLSSFPSFLSHTKRSSILLRWLPIFLACYDKLIKKSFYKGLVPHCLVYNFTPFSVVPLFASRGACQVVGGVTSRRQGRAVSCVPRDWVDCSSPAGSPPSSALTLATIASAESP